MAELSVSDAALWRKLLSRGIPEPNSGCLLWLGAVNADGYGWTGVGDGKTDAVHRLSWKLNKGPIPDGLHVLHRCDVRSCFEPTHLFLGTHDANMADRNAKGRARGGRTKPKNTILNEDAVRAIRAATGTQREIAKRFGIHFGTVNDLLLGKTWKDVR